MIKFELVKQLVSQKLTDKNFKIIDEKGLDLYGLEVLAEINAQSPVTQYSDISQVPDFYFYVFVVGIYCKVLGSQSLEEKKRYLKVSDGGITVDPPDISSLLDKLRSEACKTYEILLKNIKKQDRTAIASRRLKGRLIMDYPYGSVAVRGERDYTTFAERFWNNL